MIKISPKVQKFIVSGLSASIVNLVLMIFFVELLGFKTHLLKNIANILSIALSIVYNFIICRAWTWNNIPKRRGAGLLKQFLLFNVANLATTLLRIALFALLDTVGVYYLLNVTFGIGVAATISYFMYDKLIFNESKKDGDSVLH